MNDDASSVETLAARVELLAELVQAQQGMLGPLLEQHAQLTAQFRDAMSSLSQMAKLTARLAQRVEVLETTKPMAVH